MKLYEILETLLLLYKIATIKMQSMCLLVYPLCLPQQQIERKSSSTEARLWFTVDKKAIFRFSQSPIPHLKWIAHRKPPHCGVNRAHFSWTSTDQPKELDWRVRNVKSGIVHSKQMRAITVLYTYGIFSDKKKSHKQSTVQGSGLGAWSD